MSSETHHVDKPTRMTFDTYKFVKFYLTERNSCPANSIELAENSYETAETVSIPLTTPPIFMKSPKKEPLESNEEISNGMHTCDQAPSDIVKEEEKYSETMSHANLPVAAELSAPSSSIPDSDFQSIGSPSVSSDVAQWSVPCGSTTLRKSARLAKLPKRSFVVFKKASKPRSNHKKKGSKNPTQPAESGPATPAAGTSTMPTMRKSLRIRTREEAQKKSYRLTKNSANTFKRS